MANAFLSETDKEIGTSTATVFTCGSSTESTIIGLSVANRVTSQILVDVVLDASISTSGSEYILFLVKDAPIPVGGALVVIGGDQKVVLEPGDTIKVTSDTASSADVVLSHLDIT